MDQINHNLKGQKTQEVVDEALLDQLKENSRRLESVNAAFDESVQKLHRYYQHDMEENMAAYKRNVAQEY